MEKIDTDYKQGNLKSLAKLFKPFNRDWAPLKACFTNISDMLAIGFEREITEKQSRYW